MIFIHGETSLWPLMRLLSLRAILIPHGSLKSSCSNERRAQAPPPSPAIYRMGSNGKCMRCVLDGGAKTLALPAL